MIRNALVEPPFREIANLGNGEVWAVCDNAKLFLHELIVVHEAVKVDCGGDGNKEDHIACGVVGDGTDEDSKGGS